MKPKWEVIEEISSDLAGAIGALTQAKIRLKQEYLSFARSLILEAKEILKKDLEEIDKLLWSKENTQKRSRRDR